MENNAIAMELVKAGIANGMYRSTADIIDAYRHIINELPDVQQTKHAISEYFKRWARSLEQDLQTAEDEKEVSCLIAKIGLMKKVKEDINTLLAL